MSNVDAPAANVISYTVRPEKTDALLEAIQAEHHGARGGFSRALDAFLDRTGTFGDGVGEDLIADGRAKNARHSER